MYPQMIHLTSSQIYNNIELYRLYGIFLNSISESSKYTDLQERVINALLELDKNSDIDNCDRLQENLM